MKLKVTQQARNYIHEKGGSITARIFYSMAGG